MIDLTTWNLSIPVGVPATTIETPALAGGYQDHYFQSKNGTISFWAPVNGTTTANSEYPRSEMRETFADGTLRNWSYAAAKNTLSATTKITQVPSTGLLAFSQIHTKQGSSPPLMLGYQYAANTGYGSVVIAFRGKPSDANSKKIVLSNKIKLNQYFKYKVTLAKNGTMTISLVEPNGTIKNWKGTLDKAWKSHTLYFKAGVYTLDNSGYETEAGGATFKQLKIQHR
jgi:hypothetical protein